MFGSTVCTLHRTRRAALVALLSTACSAGLTEPRRPDPTLTVTAPSATPPVTPTIAFTESTVTVSGLIDTPTPCYAIGGRDEVRGDTLVIHLTAHEVLGAGSACVQMVATFQYTVTSSAVPASVTRVRVEDDSTSSPSSKILVDQIFRAYP